MPAPIASGDQRFACTASPTTSGRSGNSHGESVVRLPAALFPQPWPDDEPGGRTIPGNETGTQARDGIKPWPGPSFARGGALFRAHRADIAKM